MPTQSLRRFGRWLGEQADGFFRGLMRLATTPPKSWLPTGLWETLVWVFKSALWSLGTDSPIKQITASFALLVFAFLASWITLGATLVLVGFFAATMTIGIARLIPAVNAWWVRVRGTIVP